MIVPLHRYKPYEPCCDWWAQTVVNHCLAVLISSKNLLDKNKEKFWYLACEKFLSHIKIRWQICHIKGVFLIEIITVLLWSWVYLIHFCHSKEKKYNTTFPLGALFSRLSYVSHQEDHFLKLETITLKMVLHTLATLALDGLYTWKLWPSSLFSIVYLVTHWSYPFLPWVATRVTRV